MQKCPAGRLIFVGGAQWPGFGFPVYRENLHTHRSHWKENLPSLLPSTAAEMVAWPSIARRFCIRCRNTRPRTPTNHITTAIVLHSVPHPTLPGQEIRHGLKLPPLLLHRHLCSSSHREQQPLLNQKDDDALQPNSHPQEEAEEGKEEAEADRRNFISIDRTGLSAAPGKALCCRNHCS